MIVLLGADSIDVYLDENSMEFYHIGATGDLVKERKKDFIYFVYVYIVYFIIYLFPILSFFFLSK